MLETAQKLGLLPEEYDKICAILGRKPNFTELSIYAVMWSEHCSYKNSIRWLKTLPKKGKHILAEAGAENAGLVDIGGCLACAFKIESHNHPSAIEPYQGAATGVGGIHRDIFTMGARPIAALNSLRFGDPTLAKTQWMARGIVRGIGNYGNAFGVPTVAGEVYFDPCYNTNPLVNAMSVGIVEVGKTVSAIAVGVGNPVFLVGSATGKDGIHGATFASGELDSESAKKLPSVQVGDPFQEKLLLEASLEAIATGALIGMQDMGAAGITCSTSEMSAKGGSGMDVWLDKVPTRQNEMKPFEILLSESQERMLVVIEKGKEEQVKTVFGKWDLHCTQIGVVTAGPMLRYYMYDELIAEIPGESLVLGGGAPVYERAVKRPLYLDDIKKFDIDQVIVPDDLVGVALSLSGHANLSSRRPIYQQYDSEVGNNTRSSRGADAAIVRVPGTSRAIAMTVDCNPYYVYADPYVGAQMAVAEAARNLVCSGAVPSAVTNNLNFGNPYIPEVYYTFVEAVKGMGEACRLFGTPVTGGNVSFYNQSADGGAVMPTPTIGMIGLIEDIDAVTPLSFPSSGDLIYLLGEIRNDINSSQYLIACHNERLSPTPYFNVSDELLLHEAIKGLRESKLIRSAHDVSEGGLFLTLLEASYEHHLGFDIMGPTTGIRPDAYLFGESASRVVVSVSSENAFQVEGFLTELRQPFLYLGQTTQGNIKVGDTDFGSIEAYNSRYEAGLQSIFAS